MTHKGACIYHQVYLDRETATDGIRHIEALLGASRRHEGVLKRVYVDVSGGTKEQCRNARAHILGYGLLAGWPVYVDLPIVVAEWDTLLRIIIRDQGLKILREGQGFVLAGRPPYEALFILPNEENPKYVRAVVRYDLVVCLGKNIDAELTIPAPEPMEEMPFTWGVTDNALRCNLDPDALLPGVGYLFGPKGLKSILLSREDPLGRVLTTSGTAQ